MQVDSDELTRDELARALDLPADLVTDALLAKITHDELFLLSLQLCKSEPRLLEILLREVRTPIGAAPARPTGELLVRAGAALARWAASGFERVDQATYDQRLATCQACEYLSSPPKTALYRLIVPSQETRTVCGLCGCDVTRKAWLATERCPDGRWASEKS
jgi:hypothetical protein